MHSIITSIFGAVLFFLLSPGVLVRIPNTGSKFMVAGVHALAFAIIFFFLNGPVFKFFRSLEGFAESGSAMTKPMIKKN